ncbi:MAG: undecaprenyl-phosphate glucose phosphotransferase [Alphaproteobacteria bacterium]
MKIVSHNPNKDNSSKEAFSVKSPGGLKRNRFLSRKMLVEIMVAFDAVSIFAAGFAAEYIYVGFHHGNPLDTINYLSIMSLVVLTFYFVGYQRGLYDTAKLTSFSAQLSSVFYVWVTTCAFLLVVLFFLKVSDTFSRLWSLYWTLLMLLFFTVGRGGIIKFFQRMDRSGVLQRGVVLIGYGDRFSMLREYIRNDSSHYSLCGDIELPLAGLVHLEEVQQIIAAFAEQAHEYEVDDIVVALHSSHATVANLVLEKLERVAADIHIIPDLGDLHYTGIRIGRMGEFTYLTTMSKPIAGWGAFFKKVEDYILATLGLILAIPAMVIIAIAIKLDSRGPVFFRQRRHGYNHQIIEVLKFRTMTCMENGDKVVQVTRGDKRITRVGRILRRTSLDELPQLINVLKGEMSIVGPRPHAVAHNTYYGDIVENYANRHRVKPGITGWAQVHGFRGETKNPEKMAQRISYDLEYIDNWSIWLDIKIIIMTPLFSIFSTNSY